MGRAPYCSKAGLNRRTWSDEEDKLLTNYIQTHGEGQWQSLPEKAGLLRCRKSCRLRWMNYLRPGIKRGSFSADENEIIIQLQSVHGNRWSLIANELPGRTDHQIKNHWNLHLKHKMHNVKSDNEPNVSKENDTPKKNASYSSSESQSQSQSISLSLRKDQGFDNGLTRDVSNMDELLDQLLTTDVSWPNWSPLFEMEDGASNMDDLLDMPLDDLESMVKSNDENKLLKKLYKECLQLL